MGMYGSRAITLLVLISDDVINRILKLDIQTNILIYVTRCCTDLTSKVLKERTFGQSSALLLILLFKWGLFAFAIFIIIEPVHEISNNVVCATSKASGQPTLTHSLIGAFACRLDII